MTSVAPNTPVEFRREKTIFSTCINGPEHHQDSYDSDHKNQISQISSQKKKGTRGTRQEACTHGPEACQSTTIPQQKKENSTPVDKEREAHKTVTYNQPDRKIEDAKWASRVLRRNAEWASDGGLDIPLIELTQKPFAWNGLLLDNLLDLAVTQEPPTATPSSKTKNHLLHAGLREEPPENQTADTASVPDDSVQSLPRKRHPPLPLQKVIDFQRPTNNGDQRRSQQENLSQDKTKCYNIIDTHVPDMDNMGGDNRLFEKDSSQHTLSDRRHLSAPVLLACSLDDPADQGKTEQTISARAKLSGSASDPTAALKSPKSAANGLSLQERPIRATIATENEQLRCVDPNRADERSEIPSSKSLYDRLHDLHAAVALKPDSDFSADFGKGDSLWLIQNITVDLLLSPGRLLSTKDLPYWEIWRLGTFSEVEDLPVFATRLAQAGFFYDTQLNDIICFSCGLRKRHWEKSENPAIIHLSLSPNCKQANFKDDRNTPVEYYPHIPYLKEPQRSVHRLEEIVQDGENGVEDTTLSLQASSGNSGEGQSVRTGSVTMTNRVSPPRTNSRSLATTTDQGRHSSTDTASPAENPQSRSSSTSNGSLTATTLQSDGAGAQTAPPQLNSCPASSATDRGLQRLGDEHGSDGHAWTESILDMRRVASPSNATVSARRKSFLSWPAAGLPCSQQLVLAGFYYLGVGDSVKCFCCGITLRRWKENDDPWVVHVRFRFSCEYVKAIKGDEFVRQTLIQLAIGRQNGSASNGEESSSSSRTNGSVSASGSALSASAEASTTSHPAQRVTQASVANSATSANNQVSGDASPNTPDQSGQRQSVEGAPDTNSSAGVLNNTNESQPHSGGTKNSGVGNGNLGTGGKGVDGLISGTHYADATLKAATHIGAGIPTQVAVVAYVDGAAYTGSRQHGSTTNQIAAGSAANQIATDSAANQIATDSAANQFPDNSSSRTNGDTNGRNPSNQGGANRATTNQDRGGFPHANETATNTVVSTQGGEGNARSSQPDPLQSDSETTPLLQNGSHSHTSLPFMTATPENNSRRPEMTESGPSTRREHPGSSRPSRLSDGNRDQRAYLQELQDTNRRLRQNRTCCVCGERVVDTIFMPCGHLCTCASCASTIHNCCLCNKRIGATANVYLE